MKHPINFRNNIPLFYNKSSTEFRLDPYERFDEMVIRQTALHLADELWGKYPFQPVLDFILKNISDQPDLAIAEIGCGVGRMIGELAIRFPHGDCWGIDYSYQMLQQAHRFWIAGQTIHLDRAERGFPVVQIHGKGLENLQFGLAKVEALPFDDDSLDVVCSSFLLDRIDDPLKGLEEMQRVLKKNGKLLLVSPLNFQKKKHWQLLYPINSLVDQMSNLGFLKIEHQPMMIRELLDHHGNFIEWKCVAIKCSK